MSMTMVGLTEDKYLVQSHVGQIIFSTTLDTEEKVKQYYGGTTWAKIEGKFLLGASSSYANGSTGGEASHTLSVDEMPKHSHRVYAFTGGSDDTGSYTAGYLDDNGNRYDATNGAKLYHIWKGKSFQTWGNSLGTGCGDPVGSTKPVGGSQPHNNMPPYRAVYIWERTA